VFIGGRAQGGTAVRINIEGECTVARAEELRTLLLEALNSGKSIEIDLSSVTAIDLTFCQILHALQQSCVGRGIKLTLLNNLPGDLTEQAVLCGLPEIVSPATPGTNPETEAVR